MIWEGFSLRWYKDVWGDKILIASVINTLKVVCLTCFISLIGGLSCGYLISISGKKSFTLLSSVIFLPILAPDLIIAIAQALFYRALGIEKGFFTISISQSFFGVAYVGLFVSIRLRSIDFKKYLLVSSSLGASPSQSFSNHFIPLALPAALAGSGVVAALSVQDFLYAFFCGGSGSTTLSVKLYSMVKFGVNSSINVLYVFLIVLATTAVFLSEKYSRKVKNL
jgi:spermidine/putrescine transport system permease protein